MSPFSSYTKPVPSAAELPLFPKGKLEPPPEVVASTSTTLPVAALATWPTLRVELETVALVAAVVVAEAELVYPPPSARVVIAAPAPPPSTAAAATMATIRLLGILEVLSFPFALSSSRIPGAS
jgi:hypothetical protein